MVSVPHRHCKFEMDQWLAAYDVSENIDLEEKKRWEVDDATAQSEMEIGNEHVSWSS